jgi:TIR domain
VHIPELTLDDVSLLQRFQHKIQYGRSVFMSYSHEDNPFASSLKEELEKRDISVSRDVTFLKPGEEWKDALERETKSTDCFLVLISANSAKSKWVGQEVDWAMDEHRKQGLVKKIIPIVIDEEGWRAFPKSIREFQKWKFPGPENLGAFDRLSIAISDKK